MFNILLDMSKLRTASRDISLEKLQLGVNKLKIIVEEKQLEADRKSKYSEKLKNIYQSLIDEGMTDEDIDNILNANIRKKRKKRPPKYKYTDFNGNIKTWTGQGRTPSPIQLQLIKGVPLSDFEI
ncbi:DNA-binding protein H-NS [Photobacterium marinum]|uniref:DNA-binding protein n=1 Tax=Photobacterium marinum TaxID=1056511 RepID=L8J4P9_9GAMM|nr:H-NS family nucleoid-associated regulatory protein [Photobacterium marinum]ELR63178.1 DNA-binding protein H-NS [Photobacterium marinum]